MIRPQPQPMPDAWPEVAARIADEHDPSLEPYASMSREQILTLMESAGPGEEHERLNCFFMDKLSVAELEKLNFHHELVAWLLDRRGAFGFDQCLFVTQVSAEATRRLFEEMPAPGPANEIN
jgi:hypothetical protein